MADELDDLWTVKNIPDEDNLYMRVHKSMIKGGRISLGVFKNLPRPTDGMSTDWQRYSDPEATRQRALPKIPQNYGVIEINAGEVRKIPNQTVIHTPDTERNNPAHTDVFGEKDDEEIRVLFGRIYRVLLMPSE